MASPTGKVDHDTAADRAAGHAAAGASRYERDPRRTCPFYQMNEVVRIGRDGDRERNCPRDPGCFTVNRAELARRPIPKQAA